MQNAAVDASNQGLVSSSKGAAVQTAWLRHMACELLHAVPLGLLQEFQQLHLINFCLKVGAVLSWQGDVFLAMGLVVALDSCCRHHALETASIHVDLHVAVVPSTAAVCLQQHGLSQNGASACCPLQASASWSELDMWEQSDVVLTFAVKVADTACRGPLKHGGLGSSKAEQLCVLLFDVQVARYLSAMKLNQQVSQALILGACGWDPTWGGYLSCASGQVLLHWHRRRQSWHVHATTPLRLGIHTCPDNLALQAYCMLLTINMAVCLHVCTGCSAPFLSAAHLLPRVWRLQQRFFKPVLQAAAVSDHRHGLLPLMCAQIVVAKALSAARAAGKIVAPTPAFITQRPSAASILLSVTIMTCCLSCGDRWWQHKPS